MYPQIYVGHNPRGAQERRALRALALDLRTRFHAARAQEPTTLLLHFAAGDGPAATVDLLLLRQSVVIAGVVRAYRGPIQALPGGRWAYRDTGEPIREGRDRTPIQHVGVLRDAVRDRLQQAAHLLDPAPDRATLSDMAPFERAVGALICLPTTHPESRISLDVSDHRQQLKVLGLDELPALAAMVRTSPPLSEAAMRAVATDLFGGRLWHDGARFLFDLAAPRFQLRVLADGGAPDGSGDGERVLPLLEGENVIGRRRIPQKYEYRLTLTGDELISGDHATISYGDDDIVTVRDTSKNGTWITPPGGVEERVRGVHQLAPGTVLRLGVTRLRLERTNTVMSDEF